MQAAGFVQAADGEWFRVNAAGQVQRIRTTDDEDFAVHLVCGCAAFVDTLSQALAEANRGGTRLDHRPGCGWYQ
jgi:hypothetical protein